MKIHFLLILLLMCPAVSQAAFITSKTKGQEGRSCQAHLRVPQVKEKLPVVVTLNGSGIYSMANDEELSPAFGYLYQNEKAILLTIDKPGISWKNKKLHVKDKVYNQYLTTDLVLCLKNALKRVEKMKSLKFNGNIILAGHSEGVIVLARLLLDYESEKNPILKKIKLILFSGTPMEKLRTVVNRQLKKGERKKFWRAFKDKNDSYFRKWGEVSYANMANNFKLKSLEKVMKDLAGVGSNERFQFFHGLNDENIPAKPIRDLEKWNLEQLKKGKPSLNMNARYYESDHGLNLSAMNDMIAIMIGYLD